MGESPCRFDSDQPHQVPSRQAVAQIRHRHPSVQASSVPCSAVATSHGGGPASLLSRTELLTSYSSPVGPMTGARGVGCILLPYDQPGWLSDDRLQGTSSPQRACWAFPFETRRNSVSGSRREHPADGGFWESRGVAVRRCRSALTAVVLAVPLLAACGSGTPASHPSSTILATEAAGTTPSQASTGSPSATLSGVQTWTGHAHLS